MSHRPKVLTELLHFKRTLQALRRASLYQRELLLRLGAKPCRPS